MIPKKTIIILIISALVIGLIIWFAYENSMQGNGQINKIPDVMRGCIKDKLGDETYGKIESGDPEKIKDVNNNDVLSAIVFCASQLKPIAPPAR